ncbi:hypothetical protein IB234_11805 [Pseudomonas sp. PDM16]|uniref:hypothetical protein n=1 Tax=Pseudomonas sp. PDM16 TaxID=2769292 RepID=UPI00177C5C1F|nr:hypothetical protein [Pseudomonas sp. PDM16]MBD9415238.1 hypothetical protein [Pseudomonas sp. PDM16]
MNKQDLSIEGVYFLVTYLDRELLVPKIDTCMYLGMDILQVDGSYYFQDAETYHDNGKWLPGLDTLEFKILCMKEDFLENVFDYSGLQRQIELIKKAGQNITNNITALQWRLPRAL